MNLTGFGDEYFKKSNEKSKGNQALLQGYKSVLNSKGSEESLVSMKKKKKYSYMYRGPYILNSNLIYVF